MKNTLWLFSILLLFVSAALPQAQSVPAGIVARLRRQAQMTYVNTQIPHDEEYAAAVLSNGSVVYTMVSDRGGKLGLPLDIMLLLHTHPYGAQPVPSSEDKATAKKIAAPNCVVTATEVWCATADGKVVRGELTDRFPDTSRLPLGAARHSRSHRQQQVTVNANLAPKDETVHPTPDPDLNIPTTVKQAMAEIFKRNGYGLGQFESSFAIHGHDGNMNPIIRPIKDGLQADKETFELLSNDTAIVHTHPDMMGHKPADPKPSPADRKIADDNKIDMYTVSSRGVFFYRTGMNEPKLVITAKELNDLTKGKQ